jgi:hypothetical protein
MFKEIFKKQAILTEVSEEGIKFEVRLAIDSSDLKSDAIDELLKAKNNYTFTKDDKVFFMPGCNVPRFKVKQLCDKTGMTVTRSITNCTVAISGTETAKNIISTDYSYYNFTKEQILNFIEKNYSLAFAGVIEIKRFLEDENTFNIVGSSGYRISNSMRYHSENKWPKQGASDNSSANLWVTEEKRIEDFDKIFDNNIPVVFQNDLLSIINADNIMDEEMYIETDKMLESEDTNNHVLAMELIANCDYEKSCIYLLTLIKDHSSVIRNRREKDHVNFKSFLSFFGININRHLDLDDITKILTSKHLISKSDLSTLLKIAKKDFTNSLRSGYFQAGEIEANDDLLSALEKADRIREYKQSGNTQALEEELSKEKEDDDDNY